MNTIARKHPFPDLFSRPTAHAFGDSWDSIAVARIIRDSSAATGKSPAFLYLGRKESKLLQIHLGEAYGEEAVSTLHETYYMGLKVLTVDAEEYISTGGRKLVSHRQPPVYRWAS